jgi:hypothetical protein
MKFAEVRARQLRCRFHPQAWQNDYAIPVDAEGPTTWECSWPTDKPLPKDDDYDSDDLRYEGNAPQWIQEWSGPFYVEITNRDELGE